MGDRPLKPPRTTVTEEVRDEILTVTLTRPAEELGITHWPSGLLAEWLCRWGTSVSHDSISRLWRQFGIIGGWNDRCHPFIWPKDADTILATA